MKPQTSQELEIAFNVARMSADERETFINWAASLENPEIRRAAWAKAIKGLVDSVAESRIDPKTGLPNRRYFDDALTRTIDRATRHPGERYGLVYFDMNGLKKINDKSGHLAGDAAIKTFSTKLRDAFEVFVAEKLKTVVRSHEICARLAEGGDEFAVIIIDSTHNENFIEGARAHFEKALAGQIFEYEGQSYPIGAALGITEIKPGMTPESAITAADKDMYRDKLLSKERQGEHSLTPR